MGLKSIGQQLDGDGLASLKHLSEMSQQPKAGHVGTGMNVGAMLLQPIHQVMLALVHRAQGRFDILGLGDSCHGGSEENADAKGTAK